MMWKAAIAALLLLVSPVNAWAGPVVCSVREALELSPEELQKQELRVFRGVLTYYEPGHRMAFLQDPTGAIYLQITDSQPVEAGDLVEVTGIVDPGINGPNLRGTEPGQNSPVIREIGRGTWPEPVVETARRVASGLSSSLWTRIEGRISGVEIVGDRVRLSLDEVPELPVYLPGVDRQSKLPGHLKGLRVKLSGVPADSLVSIQPPVLQRSLLLPSLNQVEIFAEDREFRFAAPEALLYELRWLPEKNGALEWSRVRGVVTWSQSGLGFFLQRGTSSTWIQCTEPVTPRLGDRIECVGLPGSFHGTGVLHDAIWRPFEETLAPITPVAASVQELLSYEGHGRLVSLEGTVIETFKSPAEDVVILSSEDSTFSARLSRDPTGLGLPTVERGSRVRAIGVCLNRPSPSVELSNVYGQVQIQMRNAGDLVTLARPPFWNTARIAWLLAGLIAVSLMAAAWVIALKRRVHQQEKVIRDQVSKQAVHEERVRIAREWHDTFEQHFAGLTMQLDATATVLPPDTVSRRMLERAAEMADHSRSEARQAIWDLRAPDPEDGVTFLTELEHSLREAWPDEGDPQLEIDGEQLAGGRLPRRVTAHLLRIANEAVANARKHASASIVRVRWQEDHAEFQLEITDDGSGVPPESITNASARGHFGLLGLRERAHKLNAKLQILSPPPGASRGTTVILILPRSSIQSQ